MNKFRTSSSEKCKRTDMFLGSAGLRHQDSWKKCGEGFEGVPQKGPRQVKKAPIWKVDSAQLESKYGSSTEDKEIAIFSSDSEDDKPNIVQPQRTGTKRKRANKQKPVKQLFTPHHASIAENDDFNIDSFSPSKLSGNSLRLSSKVSEETERNIDIKIDNTKCLPDRLPSPVGTTFRLSGTQEIADYSSGEEQDSRLLPENYEIDEGPDEIQVAALGITPSRSVLQRLKLDSVNSENEEPPRMDYPSPRKRPKYLKGQLADRLAKMMPRETSQIAFWKHQVSKNMLKETTRTMTLQVQDTHTSFTLTFAKCKVLDASAEGRFSGLVTILLNKEQTQSLKICETQVLQIHPPWQEINMANGKTVLLCGKFCQVIKPAENSSIKSSSPQVEYDETDCMTCRWIYQIDENELTKSS